MGKAKIFFGNLSALGQKDEFTINQGQEIPVYNALKGGYEPAVSEGQSFATQFALPNPEIIEVPVKTSIYLPDITCIDKSSKPISVFNPKAGFRSADEKKKNKIEQKSFTSSKTPETPHFYSVLKGAYVYNKTESGYFNSLKPVPVVELTEQQQSYTRELNQYVRQSPFSEGNLHATDAIMGLLIGFILYFLYMRTVFGKQVRMFFKSTFNRVRAENVLDETNVTIGRASFLLNLFYFFVLGLLFTLMLDFNGFIVADFSFLKTFFATSGFITLLYFGKWLMGWILAFILKIHDETRAYFFHSFVFNKSYGIIVFPFLLVSPYVNSALGGWILKGAIILLSIFYLMRFMRNLSLSLQRNISLFYMFLYLCALEIIPILVIIKIVSEWLKLPIF